MLPSIMTIAEKYGLEINHRTRRSKEVYAKCPFCGDQYPHKHHLSLNQEKDVFKCWNCKKSGGVLQLEEFLSGMSFDEVRSQYFGNKKSKKNLHPAYQLSPSQLQAIGWGRKKRDDFDTFVRSRDEVLKDWEIYKFEELSKFYALFLLIANYPIEKEKVNLYKWFIKLSKESKIDSLRNIVEKQYKEPKDERWAKKGEEIALIAHETSIASGDFSYKNIFLNVLLAIELLKIKQKEKINREKISV